MSIKKIQINIPEPCDQNFSEMIPAQGGNFCGSCEKVIVDFTDLTDGEIAKIFMKKNGKICGQFRKNQLDRNINLSPPAINSYRGKAASIFLSGILTTGVGNAQNNFTPPHIVENQQLTNTTQMESSKKKEDYSSSNKPKTVKLMVVDDHDEALIGASVIIKDYENFGTVSDIDGSVKLTLPNEIKENEITLIISYIGFQTKEVSINFEEYDFNLKKVILNGFALTGEVIIVGYTKPTTLYQVVRNWFYKLKFNRGDRKENRQDRREKRREKRADIKATQQLKKKSSNKIIQLPPPQFSISLKNTFPNPFSDEINLEIYSATKSDIQISLFNISGQKIYQVTQGVIEGNQNVYLNLKNVRLEDGEYILHLREKDGQVQSRKLIRLNNGE
ncbi:MAG: carboxypeptidase-like regulatory domain-containing protein [Saprospiraceae bacterium]